jgi:hypothetical protein
LNQARREQTFNVFTSSLYEHPIGRALADAPVFSVEVVSDMLSATAASSQLALFLFEKLAIQN